MTIAVNLTNHNNPFESTYAQFLVASIQQVASHFSQHQFIIVANKPMVELEGIPNVLQSIFELPKKNTLKKINYSLKINSALNQKSIDCIISAANNFNEKTKKKQHLFIESDLPGIYIPKQQKTIAAFLKKAESIFTLGEPIRKKIETQFPDYSSKITETNLLINPNYQPIHWKKREEIKEKISKSNEYFFIPTSTQAIHELKNVLLAFSIFKKMQKSNMQLVIATTEENTSLATLLKNYKYRNDVVCIHMLKQKELYETIASAYVILTMSDETIIHAVNGMQSNVPVISCNADFAKYIFGEDALYIDNTQVKIIADQLMLLFKDEGKRTELIEQGKNRTAGYQNNAAAIHFWNKILL